MVHFLVAVEIFVPCEVSGPDLIFTNSPILLAPGALSAAVKRPGREADHSQIFVSRSRMSGALPQLPDMLSCRAQGQFCLHLDPWLWSVNYWLNRAL